MRALDREEVAQHNLTVVATDHGFPRRSATQLLSVLVLDVNDEAPVFTQPDYEAGMRENLPSGTSVLQVRATDRDLGECQRWAGRQGRAVVPQAPSAGVIAFARGARVLGVHHGPVTAPSCVVAAPLPCLPLPPNSHPCP